MPINITPRVGTRVGPMYLGANIRAPHRAPQGSSTAPRTAPRGYGAAPRMQPTTQQQVRSTRPRVSMVRPNAGGVVLLSLAMLLTFVLALVAMVLLAVGAGIVPMSSPSSNPSPTSSAATSAGTGHTGQSIDRMVKG